jgi:hypothetical protein
LILKGGLSRVFIDVFAIGAIFSIDIIPIFIIEIIYFV